MNPETAGSPIVFSGHIDTVFEVGAFGAPTVKREGNKIYGPGVVDCKGGVVSALYAMDVLRRGGYTVRKIMLILQTDEETNSSLSNGETINHICNISKEAIAFLNLEGHTRGEMCLVRKGILTAEFTVTGKAAHASKCATQGSSAILEAANKIISLEAFKDAGGITACVGVIKGGNATNTVPDECRFKCNFRFSSAAELEYIKDFVSELINNSSVPGCECAVKYTEFRPAMEENEKSLDLFNKINAIFEKNGLPVLKIGRRTGGSDAANVCAAGIPCIDSIGTSGDFIHTTAEFAYVASLREAAERLVFIARDL
ncbi:MAG: M20/M25/M40 family metallo-hydrolase [Clostridia bacterium]|nr:M20/M25/M40 family metallo-hydrolase [Clostridia bacterium]